MSNQGFSGLLIMGFSLFFLTSCNQNNPENIEGESGKLPLPLAQNKQGAIEPGSYCFEQEKNAETKVTAQLLIASDLIVTGVIESFKTPQDKQAKSNLQEREFVAGILNENQLQVTINKEKDPQNKTREETWSLTSKKLTMNQVLYNAINCENLISK